MTPSPAPGPLFVAVVLFSTLLIGCGSGGSGSESATVDPNLVSEFRLEISTRAHVVDTGIAALEAVSASGDSALAARYQQTIDELLQARHNLQQGLGSMDSLTVAQFRAMSDSLTNQLSSLALRVDRAPFDLAPDVRSLREVAADQLSVLRSSIDELRVGADSTLEAELVGIAARSVMLEDSLRSAAEAPLDELRRMSVASLGRLRSSFDSLRSEQALRGARSDSPDSN